MTIEDRTKLRNIAVRLQATLDELKELEKTTEDGGVKQAALSGYAEKFHCFLQSRV